MPHSICQQIWKTQQWPQDRKRSIFIPIPKKGNAKECSNYLAIALISHASKLMLKFSKPGFNSTWTSWTELNILGWLSHKESPAMQEPWETFDPCIWKIPWKRKWQLTPVFSPGESNRQKCLPSRLWSSRSQRVRHDWSDLACRHTLLRPRLLPPPM